MLDHPLLNILLPHLPTLAFSLLTILLGTLIAYLFTHHPTNTPLAPPPEDLLNKPRPAPPRLTPLQFPSYTPHNAHHPLTRTHALSLRHHLTTDTKTLPTHSAPVLSHLNIDLTPCTPLPLLVPDASRDRPFHFDNDLRNLLTELSTDNEDAFREVLRQPVKEGRTKVKLLYSRGFFAVLEECRGWCDGSADRYFEEDDVEGEGGKGVAEEGVMEQSSQGVRSASENARVTAEIERIEPVLPTKLPASLGTVGADMAATTTAAAIATATANPSIPTKSPSSTLSVKQKKLLYTGYRHSSSAQLPGSTRAALLRSFLKMAIHTFGLRDHDVARTEKLRVQDVEIPGFVCRGGGGFVVAKVPREREEARKRRVVGPVLGGRVVGEVRWRREGQQIEVGGDDGLGEVVSDGFELGREVGGLVQLAVMRAREGIKSEEAEVALQEGWWWAKKGRWGGGEVKWGMRADEVYEEDDPSWSPWERERQDEKRRDEAKVKRMTEVMEMQQQQQQKGNGLDINDLLAGSGGKEGMEAAFGKIQQNLEGIGYKSPAAKSTRVDERTRRGREDRSEMREGRRVMYTAPQKKKFLRDWTVVRPNGLGWDEKVIWKGFGKADEEGYDEVFQLTVLNHHLAIAKLRVSSQYLRWLDAGKDVQEQYDESSVLKMWRSRWYDMFNVEDRTELLEGLWRVLGWCMRDELK